MQTFTGLCKFIRQGRSDAVGSLKETQRIKLVEITYDKSHRHGFTNGSAQTQHDAANDARLRIGQNHFGYHLPSGGAQTVRRFFEQGWCDLKHISHHRRNERNDHDGQNDAGR